MLGNAISIAAFMASCGEFVVPPGEPEKVNECSQVRSSMRRHAGSTLPLPHSSRIDERRGSAERASGLHMNGVSAAGGPIPPQGLMHELFGPVPLRVCACSGCPSCGLFLGHRGVAIAPDNARDVLKGRAAGREGVGGFGIDEVVAGRRVALRCLGGQPDDRGLKGCRHRFSPANFASWKRALHATAGRVVSSLKPPTPPASRGQRAAQ